MRLIIVGIVILIFAVGGYYLWQNQSGATPIATINTPFSKPSPSPFPFEDLTIPYLKNRSYESVISNLNQVGDNQSYTSYTVSYASDGLKINGLLTKPKGEEPEGGWPAIVFVHGYIVPKSYQTLTNYTAYVDSLAKAGLVVFKIDLRGHAQSEGEAGGAYYSSDYVIDVLNAHSALSKEDFVNGDKIGLWGHSMAGNVVFRSLAAKPQIGAVVIWAGAVYSYEDFSEFGIDDDSYRPPSEDSERQRKRRELFATYGEFDKDSYFWKQVSPTNYLDGINGRVQIHHATGDPVVDIRYSRNLKALLDKSSVEVELHEYESGGHNLSGSAFNAAMSRTAEFFKENL